MYQPIGPYGMFRTMYTPVIPQFYRNIYSQEEGIKKILLEIDSICEYLDRLAGELNGEEEARNDLAHFVNTLSSELNDLREYVNQYLRGGMSRDPIDGSYSNIYGIIKQMFDYDRAGMCTWNQLKSLNVTWAQLAKAKYQDKPMTYVDFELQFYNYVYDIPDYSYNADVFSTLPCYNPVSSLDTDAGGYQSSEEVK